MGTIIYDPRKKKGKDTEKIQRNKAEVIDVEEVRGKSKEGSVASEERYNALIENIDSVRPMGDTDCDYVIYLEDYVYTYIYQYANTDLSCEHSAAIIGEYYPDSKEMIICGIMPISKDKLSTAEEWINEEVIQDLYKERETYFPGATVLGWLHMQPGYGTMLTMKEVKAHREVFEKEGTLLLLIDPINKIETFYVYEDDTLKEQSGYYMYYDKNPCMQRYMLDRPLVSIEKEEEPDNVVNQFREIGRMRKKEYEQKKKMNLTVVAASIALLALSAVVLKMNDQNGKVKDLENQLAQMADRPAISQSTNTSEDPNAKFIFNNTEDAIDASTGDVKIINNATQDPILEEVDKEAVDQTAKEEPKEEAKEEPKVQEDNVSQEVSENEETAKEEETPKEDIVAKESVSNEPVSNEAEDEDYISYVVQEGDSLRKISYDHYQTELRTKEIIALNNLENGDYIHVGQTLKLPAE